MKAGVEKYRKGQEDAAMAAAARFHPITREMARAIIDAVWKYMEEQGSVDYFGHPTPEEQYRSEVERYQKRKRRA